MKNTPLLKKLVAEEAKNLKKFATKKEKSNLVFSLLNANDQNYCVYGQMTGSCFTQRAANLILKCCSRVIRSETASSNQIQYGKLNGSPKEPRDKYGKIYWSPIENFIRNNEIEDKEENNFNLIAYLKGETKRLIIK